MVEGTKTILERMTNAYRRKASALYYSYVMRMGERILHGLDTITPTFTISFQLLCAHLGTEEEGNAGSNPALSPRGTVRPEAQGTFVNYSCAA